MLQLILRVGYFFPGHMQFCAEIRTEVQESKDFKHNFIIMFTVFSWKFQ
jgi:hypothetical protein